MKLFGFRKKEGQGDKSDKNASLETRSALERERELDF